MTALSNTSLSQIVLSGDVLDSAPRLHVQKGSDGRIAGVQGSKGSFIAGGPLLSGKQVIQVAGTANQVLTAAELVGGIVLMDDTDAGRTITTPSAAQIVAYLSSQQIPTATATVNTYLGAGGSNRVAASSNPLSIVSFECDIKSRNCAAGNITLVGGAGVVALASGDLPDLNSEEPDIGLYANGTAPTPNYTNFRVQFFVRNYAPGSESVAFLLL
jgi:hypothetical protein